MWNWLKKIQWINKKLLNFLIFMLLLGWIFVRTTYLFRNCTYDREHVIGIRSEKNIDVVCIGGSSTLVYWEPYQAWKEYGITSYNLATNSVGPPLMEGYVKYALSTQEPDLLVIDVRSFTGKKRFISDSEGGIRNATDSMALSDIRFQMITETLKYFDAFNDRDIDVVSYYFDISKYHEDYERLGKEINWRYMNNECVSEYKGFEFIEDPCHSIIQKPIDYRTEDIKKLEPKRESCLKKLLKYLSENNIDALFVAGPIPISREDEMQYNAIGEIVTLYGYNFLNTNDYYKEMSIDFAKDFYNTGHVNVYGAEKYTRFVSDYIKDHYHITDHRGDKEFAQWEADYQAAKEREIYVKELIDQQINIKKEANHNGCGLKDIKDNLAKWCNIASDENYTILAMTKGDIPGINIHMPGNILNDKRDVIRIFTGNTMIYESNHMLDEAYRGWIGTDGIEYSINSGTRSELIVDGKQYMTEKDGIYMLVFDNNYNQVLDVVVISDDSKSIEHINEKFLYVKK